jgi:hypothetical protein
MGTDTTIVVIQNHGAPGTFIRGRVLDALDRSKVAPAKALQARVKAGKRNARGGANSREQYPIPKLGEFMKEMEADPEAGVAGGSGETIGTNDACAFAAEDIMGQTLQRNLNANAKEDERERKQQPEYQVEQKQIKAAKKAIKDAQIIAKKAKATAKKTLTMIKKLEAAAEKKRKQEEREHAKLEKQGEKKKQRKTAPRKNLKRKQKGGPAQDAPKQPRGTEDTAEPLTTIGARTDRVGPTRSSRDTDTQLHTHYA